MSGHVQREMRGHDGRTCASSKPHDFGRPHTHVLGNQASVIVARPHVPTKSGHAIAQIVGVHKRPYKCPYISTQLHVSPRISHEILVAQLTAGLPRFGQFWPQTMDIHDTATNSMGDHEFLDGHNVICVSTKSTRSLVVHTRPRNLVLNHIRPHVCMGTQKVANLVRPRYYMGAHKVSWMLTHEPGRSRSFWALTHKRGRPRRDILVRPPTTTHNSMHVHVTIRGHPEHVQPRPISASLGRPIMWPTSRILGHHNIADGAPRYCYGLPRYLLAVHVMLWATKRQHSWATTRYCGQPREFVVAHV